MKKSLLIFLIVLSLEPLYANMRGPKILPNPSGRSIVRSSERIEVKSESIVFRCPEFEKIHSSGKPPLLECDVTISYHIQSDKDYKNLELIFVSPESFDMNLTAKDRKGNLTNFTFKEREILKLETQQEENLQYSNENYPIYETSFVGNILKDSVEIIVKYRQSLSLFEIGYGYFSTGYWRYEFTYYTYPIKDWKLSKDFFIDFRLEIMEQKPSLFSGLFEKDLNLYCGASEFGEYFSEQDTEFAIRKKIQSTRKFEPNPNSKSIDLNSGNFTFKEDRLILQSRINNFLPDVLKCSYYK